MNKEIKSIKYGKLKKTKEQRSPEEKYPSEYISE